MRRAVTRPLIMAALGAVLASGCLATNAAAADGGLVVITDASYKVLPSESRVHVTLSSVATSFEPDTAEDASTSRASPS